jgi:hypothetical protein
VLKEGGAARLEELVGGRARVFPGTGFHLDFDELAREAEEDAAGEADASVAASDSDDELEEALLRLAPSFHVASSEIVLDEAGRATLWRAGRFERAGEWLEAFEEEVIRRDLAADAPPAAEPIDVDGLPFPFDLESWTQFRDQVLRGEPVWRLDRDAFVVEAAMTPVNAEGCIAAITRDDVEAKYENGRLRLRYRPGPGGWIRSTFLIPPEPPKVDYDAGVARKLVESGLEVGPVERYSELRAAAGLR